MTYSPEQYARLLKIYESVGRLTEPGLIIASALRDAGRFKWELYT